MSEVSCKENLKPRFSLKSLYLKWFCLSNKEVEWWALRIHQAVSCYLYLKWCLQTSVRPLGWYSLVDIASLGCIHGVREHHFCLGILVSVIFALYLRSFVRQHPHRSAVLHESPRICQEIWGICSLDLHPMDAEGSSDGSFYHCGTLNSRRKWPTGFYSCLWCWCLISFDFLLLVWTETWTLIFVIFIIWKI